MRKALCVMLALCLALLYVPCVAEETYPLTAEFEARLEAEGALGNWVTWSLEDMRKYEDVIGLQGELLDEAPEGWLTRDEAIDLAVRCILDNSGVVYPQAWYGVRDPLQLTEDYLRGLTVTAVPAQGTETGSDIWYLWLYEPDWLVPALDCFALRIDAHSGDIPYYQEPGGLG